jgi:hypothetical protein
MAEEEDGDGVDAVPTISADSVRVKVRAPA